MWRTGQEVAENVVRKKIIKWNGHKHKQRKLTSIVHNCNPPRKTTCWTPKARWMDNIVKDLKMAGFLLYGVTTRCNRVRLEKLVRDRREIEDRGFYAILSRTQNASTNSLGGIFFMTLGGDFLYYLSRMLRIKISLQ